MILRDLTPTYKAPTYKAPSFCLPYIKSVTVGTQPTPEVGDSLVELSRCQNARNSCNAHGKCDAITSKCDRILACIK